MKFGPHRVKAFKQYFIIVFCTLTVIQAIPDIVNYYIAWMQPVSTKEQLLRWLWIIPTMSFLAAIVIALLTKEESKKEPSSK